METGVPLHAYRLWDGTALSSGHLTEAAPLQLRQFGFSTAFTTCSA
jgi:hypothetical protein